MSHFYNSYERRVDFAAGQFPDLTVVFFFIFAKFTIFLLRLVRIARAGAALKVNFSYSLACELLQ